MHIINLELSLASLSLASLSFGLNELGPNWSRKMYQFFLAELNHLRKLLVWQFCLTFYVKRWNVTKNSPTHKWINSCKDHPFFRTFILILMEMIRMMFWKRRREEWLLALTLASHYTAPGTLFNSPYPQRETAHHTLHTHRPRNSFWLILTYDIQTDTNTNYIR